MKLLMLCAAQVSPSGYILQQHLLLEMIKNFESMKEWGLITATKLGALF